jgi:transcriptional regulator with XRE-family HTH domain
VDDVTVPEPSPRDAVRAEIREFLSTRRARITPKQAGLPTYGGDRRRVPGLRREETALLVGVSPQYYIRLERGDATGVSESVIDGIAHALRLDDAERAHLLDLLHTAGAPSRAAKRSARVTDRVRATIRRLVEAMPTVPAVVLNGRLDVLAANPLGRAPYDRRLSDLVGELSTRNEDFRVRWAAHDVRIHSTGIKKLHHPVVGDLDLPFESLPIETGSSTNLVAYLPEPGTPTEDALALLASWAASETNRTPDEAADQRRT